jgi:outer membrane protein
MHTDTLIERARRLLEQRQPRQAYDLLLPHESLRAGDPEFDYLLGIAATDAGVPERGVFAFERVLALQPNHHLARAEIARAFLLLGERDSARREFEIVRRQPVPASVKQVIDHYLSAIAAGDVVRLTRFLEPSLAHETIQ